MSDTLDVTSPLRRAWGCAAPTRSRISSRVRRAAMRSPSWPMSTPKWHGWMIGGQVIRTQISPRGSVPVGQLIGQMRPL